LEVRYCTLESILEARGLTAVERLAKYEPQEDLGDGVTLVTEQTWKTAHQLFGLQIGWAAFYDGLTRKQLSEKMQALGDRIWEALNSRPRG
jgi:hypothetical protein